MRKKLLFTICAFCITITPDMAFAALVHCGNNCSEDSCEGIRDFRNNCTKWSLQCLGTLCIYSCDTCDAGYDRLSQQVEVDRCTNKKTAYYCSKYTPPEPEPDPCEACPDALDGPTYTDWVKAPYYAFSSSTVTVPGYQVRTKTTCDESTSWECKNTTEVRCAKGWYGLRPQQTTSSSSSGGGIGLIHYEYSGCTQCPEFNGGDGNTVSGQSAAGTAAEITDCYVEYDGENPFYDNTGDYIFINPCYYSYESGDCRVRELATGAPCASANSVWGLGTHCETTKYIRLDSADMCFSQCATCPSGYEMLIRTTTYSGCNITFQTCGEI